MRQISKRVEMNKDTFAPEIILEIGIPLEVFDTKKAYAISEKDFAQIIGQNLIEMVREKM